MRGRGTRGLAARGVPAPRGRSTAPIAGAQQRRLRERPRPPRRGALGPDRPAGPPRSTRTLSRPSESSPPRRAVVRAGRVCVCVCVRARALVCVRVGGWVGGCVRACVRARTCVCLPAYVRVRACVRACACACACPESQRPTSGRCDSARRSRASASAAGGGSSPRTLPRPGPERAAAKPSCSRVLKEGKGS